jgi:SAM-dependent methyltransferase
MDPYDRLKEATRWMWALGDYPDVASFLEPQADALAVAANVVAGSEVLDVAAGNGNFAIAAARRGARVTATDLTPKMIELGRSRTSDARLRIEWREADAEALPFENNRFDVVASVFGAMFAPRPDRVAAELFRVAKPGGVVAMANYSKPGFLGSFADLMTKFSNPPPAGLALPSPFDWGDPDTVRRRFVGMASSVDLRSGVVIFSFPSPEDGWTFWERTNPPLIALKSMAPPDRFRELVEEGKRLMRAMNGLADGRLALESEYLQVVARKPTSAA